MPRTLINLHADDKAWLDAEARARKVPMTELVREAVGSYRAREEARRRPHLAEALRASAGIWRQGDGLHWQRRLRAEWDREE